MKNNPLHSASNKLIHDKYNHDITFNKLKILLFPKESNSLGKQPTGISPISPSLSNKLLNETKESIENYIQIMTRTAYNRIPSI